MVSGSQLLKFVYLSYWKKGAQHLENEFLFYFQSTEF